MSRKLHCLYLDMMGIGSNCDRNKINFDLNSNFGTNLFLSVSFSVNTQN